MTVQKLAKAPTEQLSLPLPLFSSAVQAGFPSPADDFLDCELDLNEHLIGRPAATFFARAEGDSLQGIGIYDQDILIVDRSLEHRHGAVVIAAINGELTCKILDTRERLLRPANPDYPPIPIGQEEDLVIEGVVTYSIKSHQR